MELECPNCGERERLSEEKPLFPWLLSDDQEHIVHCENCNELFFKKLPVH